MLNPELQGLVALAHAAGQEIMKIYASEFTAHTKSDQSPVTEADVAAEAIILNGLAKVYPGIPVVAEEQVAKGVQTQAGHRFLLVDPLDGTKEFISRNGQFTVNIGLVENGVPVCGVVHAPALGETFVGRSTGGAYKLSPMSNQFHAISARKTPKQGATILASRSHMDAETQAFIAQQCEAEVINAGSSLKFCRLAEGKADLYPRFGRTMEWDTAAGHAVLIAAGGAVVTPENKPFLYGKPGYANGPFIARGAA